MNIFGQESTEGTDSIPSYMIAADNHNTGNMNPSIFQAEEEGNIVSRAGKFIAVSAASGINSFYNTAVWAGNMFSDKDAQYRDTRDWINTFDEDLGAYYQENRQAADLVGFVASSFIPGLGGVKVFNAGVKALTAAKEGAVGVNMAKGLGILPGSRGELVKAAVASYDGTRTAFSLTNPATLKAVAAGFGEQALQAAAFETAVAITMKKSPILADADVGDMISHIATGTLLGGAIGGVIEGAGTLFKIRQGIKAMDTKLAGVTQDMLGVAGTSASDELLIIRNDLDTLPMNAPEGADPELYAKLWEQKITRLDNRSREQFTAIAGDNAEMGNRIYEAIRTDPTGAFSGKVAGLEQIFVHADSAKMVKKFKLDEEGTPFDLRHLKLWGDDMGKLSDEAPAALHLADTIRGTVDVRAGKVIAGDKSFVVDVRGKPWSTAEASYQEALARNIWAMDDTVPALALRKNEPYLKIGENDIPMLTKAYREGFKDFKLITAKGEEIAPPSDLLSYLKQIKNDGATNELIKAIKSGKELPAEHFANKYDTPLGFFTGEQYSTDAAEAIFGLQSAQKSFYARFHANTPNPPAVETVKPWLQQQNYKMVYDTSKVATMDNFQVEAMTLIRQRQVIQQATNDMAVASALGDRAEMLPDFTDAELARVNRGGAGAGFFSFANASYGSAGSKAEYVGARVTDWIQKAGDQVANDFMVANYAIVNSPTDTARLAAILQKTRSTGSVNAYVMDDAGQGLVLRSVRDYERKIAAGEEATPPIIPQGVDEKIDLGTDAVRNWVKQHITSNGKRLEGFNNIRAAKGQPAALDREVFYPPQPNPDRFQFHAFVSDSSKVTSTGHTSMLYANDAVTLEKQIAEARAQGFDVFTRDQTEQYYKARGLYDYTKGLNENQIDTALRRGGSSAPAFPLTGNPQEMIKDIMEWHSKEEAKLIREAVSTKYSRQFGTLKQMGDEYASLNQSKMGWKGKFQGEAQNPFQDYIKTFLGASLKSDYPLWTALNNFVDEAGTRVYNTISGVWKGSATQRGMAGPKKLANGQYDWEEVNNVFDKYGMKMAATDAQMEAWVTHPAGKAVVSKFIQQQNSILSSLVLRLDPVNALNNAFGSTILTGAETASVVRGILAGNEEAVGELAKLSRINVPGTTDSITSPAKLIASAYKAFFSPDSAELIATYKRKGYISDLSGQFKQLLEVATIKGTETAAELESKSHKMFELFKKVGDFGEKWTGNKVAEEMNRFVSANIMDQITGVAVKRGLMDEKSADTYINTFVNRTQGNMIASQRPQMFQGPVGQAIGLFQTYQFNIMQQLLRYVGEGSKKDALTLLGLQGTVYGMNGLPAFQAINQHIIGTASGNTNHTDAYSSVNNIVGKNAGDWITYGVASNFLIDPDLKINLYSRGDINPRQVTVVPTNMAEIPIVSSWAKLASSTKNALGSVANGGDVWNSLLSGIEQNGINRPLAGLARVARGIDDGVSYSTSGKGNVVSANDFYSLANMARITGAKPFDEAVTQDAVYRIQAYQAVDKAKRTQLGIAVKSVVADGGVPSQEQLNEFMSGYVKAGGKQEEFSKWYVAQIRAATTPQANKIVENAKSPYASYMQSIMGGRVMATPPDILRNQPPPTDE
jgi:hypothetical protein